MKCQWFVKKEMFFKLLFKLTVTLKKNYTYFLKVALAEFIDMPGNFLLLANTHLYFHQSGDFIRLVQTIICVKYLEKIKKNLLSDKFTKSVNILFAGDFNSAPDSNPIKYILKGDLDLKEEGCL